MLPAIETARPRPAASMLAGPVHAAAEGPAEHRHGSFMRFIGTNLALSRCFDPGDARARRYLDFLIDVDDAAGRYGVLPPLEIWGIYRPRLAGER